MCSQENDLYIIKTPDLPYQPHEGGMGPEFLRSMTRIHDKIAQIDAATGRTESFSELLNRSIKLALYMRSQEISVGDIICICSYNSMDTAVPFIASQFLGAVVCSMDDTSIHKDLNQYLVNMVKPKMIFSSPDHIQQVECILEELKLENVQIVILGHSTKYIELKTCLDQAEEKVQTFIPNKIKSNKETAIIFFSSGTTGMPKGICLSHYSMLSQVVNSAMCQNIDEEFFLMEKEKYGNAPMVSLSFASFYGITGGLFIISSIMFGFSRLICKKFDALETWKNIDRFKVYLLSLPPFLVYQMLDVGKPDNVSINSLRRFPIGGTRIKMEQLLKLRKIFKDSFVYQTYTQTELAGCTIGFQGLNKNHRKTLTEKPGSVGFPFPGMNFRVVDLKTEKDLGPNQVGELRVQTSFCMNGYYNQDCSEAFDSKGWLKTGDLLYYDEDGCFYFEERIKEVIKFKDWPLIPTMIENVVMKHPDVKEVVVLGIPHDVLVEIPIAVVLKQENSDIKAEDLKKFVDSQADERHKLLGGVRFIDEMPYTPTGKIARRQIKQMILNGTI